MSPIFPPPLLARSLASHCPAPFDEQIRPHPHHTFSYPYINLITSRRGRKGGRKEVGKGAYVVGLDEGWALIIHIEPALFLLRAVSSFPPPRRRRPLRRDHHPRRSPPLSSLFAGCSSAPRRRRRCSRRRGSPSTFLAQPPRLRPRPGRSGWPYVVSREGASPYPVLPAPPRARLLYLMRVWPSRARYGDCSLRLRLPPPPMTMTTTSFLHWRRP